MCIGCHKVKSFIIFEHALLKNAKDSSLAESSCLTLALATHTKKIKYFDG